MMAWMEALVAAKGSDLHLKVGSPPRMRVDGRLVMLEGPMAPLPGTDTVLAFASYTLSAEVENLFLTGGAAALPAALQGLAAGIVNLTCQGNSSASLNALNLSDNQGNAAQQATAMVRLVTASERSVGSMSNSRCSTCSVPSGVTRKASVSSTA